MASSGWAGCRTIPEGSASEIDTGCGAASVVGHETPYLHAHITATSSRQTVCGRLMEGSPSCRNNLERGS